MHPLVTPLKIHIYSRPDLIKSFYDPFLLTELKFLFARLGGTKLTWHFTGCGLQSGRAQLAHAQAALAVNVLHEFQKCHLISISIGEGKWFAY